MHSLNPKSLNAGAEAPWACCKPVNLGVPQKEGPLACGKASQNKGADRDPRTWGDCQGSRAAALLRKISRHPMKY